MQIKLTYMAQIKTITGVDQENIEVPEQSSVQDLILAICAKYGSTLETMLLDDNKRLRRVILVFVGDEQCFWDDNPQLIENQHVTFMSPIAGGT